MEILSLLLRGLRKVCLYSLLFFSSHASTCEAGHAEQWGSVTRKKDKKATPAQTKDASFQKERSEFRGARGGRGGRGGPGRGGAARGTFARGGHHETNGFRPKSSQAGDVSVSKRVEEVAASDAVTPSTPTNGSAKLAEDASQAWGAAPASPAWDNAPADSTATTTSAWATSTPSTWGGDAAVNGSASPAVPANHAPSPKVVKTPATSKLSWAQIAR